MAEIADTDGSSPRVRGTRTTGELLRSGHAVHPRVCGERDHPDWHVYCAGGSSPRVRGTRSVGSDQVPSRRFIPACAGNAWPKMRPPDLTTVHPRVCGERSSTVSMVRHRNGSSPRVRGTPHALRCCSPRRRFIPACAGNAPNPFALSAPTPVHPRVCGERRSVGTCAKADAGSSPRVRGTLPRTTWGGSAHRFIPACAGNALCGSIIRR